MSLNDTTTDALSFARPAQIEAPRDDDNDGYEINPWKELKPLQRQAPPCPDYPIEALGSVLAPACQTIIRATQAPPALVAQSFLSAAGLAAQGHADVVIDGRRSPISNFFITIGESGERKSAVDAFCLKAHREFEEGLRAKYKVLRDAYSIEKAAYDKTRDKILAEKNTGQSDRVKQLTALGPGPTAPLEPSILLEEPTYEGLVKLLDIGQPSVGLFAHEGGTFIGGHGMNQESLLRMLAGISALWDGRAITRTRGGDGNKHIPGKRLSMHLMCQSQIADMLLNNDIAKQQGFLSRCLLAKPDSTAGTRMYVEMNPAEEGSMRIYYNTIDTILKKAPPLKSDSINELEPRTLSLTPEAKRQWIRFHNGIESNMASTKSLSRIRGFSSKVPEHALRLAGVLAFMDDYNATDISQDCLQRAIALMEFYVKEALRLADITASGPDLVLAEQLLLWLKARGNTAVSLVEIYQRGPAAIRDAIKARKIMGILIEHGWARPAMTPVEYDGTPRKEAFEVRSDAAE